jgi:hypothetical protein
MIIQLTDAQRSILEPAAGVKTGAYFPSPLRSKEALSAMS